MRRAAVSVSGEVDTDLFERLRKNVRVWTSDGADRDVGLAATAVFPGLCFHAWDESHSAVRLLSNALKDDPEIQMVEQLLVTGKTPHSLAKFLSTLDVFRNKFGDAQMQDQVAFVKNFGWAPQRYQSRARPYARECRRWNSIWTSVAAEAGAPHGAQGARRTAVRLPPRRCSKTKSLTRSPARCGMHRKG